MIKACSAFLDNNPNLNHYPTLINKATLHNNAVPLIITNNSDNKHCIPKDITISTSELIDSDSYSISEATLTARPNDIKTDTQTNPTQKTHTVNTPIKDNA